MSEQIAKWKELIRKGKENKSKEQGRLEMLMHRLKTDFEHDSVEDLDKEIKEVQSELEEKREKLKNLTEKFENEYLERLEIAAR